MCMTSPGMLFVLFSNMLMTSVGTLINNATSEITNDLYNRINDKVLSHTNSYCNDTTSNGTSTPYLDEMIDLDAREPKCKLSI